MSKLITEKKGNKMVISRTFDAPRDLVFEVHSDCNHLMNWYGGEEWPLNYCKMDFRPGGKWHFCMKGPNEGDESWGLALYKEIIEPEKIVYNDYFSDKEGNINENMPAFDVVLTFENLGEQTKVTMHSEVGSKEEVDKLVEMGMIEGFTQTWDRLDELLEKLF